MLDGAVLCAKSMVLFRKKDASVDYKFEEAFIVFIMPGKENRRKQVHG